MAVQEIAVSNTPIKGTIEINKWGSVLKGFSENQDTLGYTVHTPLYQDDWLPGAVYEVRAAEDIVGKDQTVWFREGELAATLTTTADSSVVTDPLPLGRYIVTEVSAPAGYMLDETRHELALTASDHTTPVVTARLSAVNEHMNSRPKNPQYARNKNVLVIGGSGSGKTRFFVKPNIMQCTKTKGTSLVVTDPKGTLVVECGKMLAAAGYDVRILNTINFKKSMHYNGSFLMRSDLVGRTDEADNMLCAAHYSALVNDDPCLCP